MGLSTYESDKISGQRQRNSFGVHALVRLTFLPSPVIMQGLPSRCQLQWTGSHWQRLPSGAWSTWELEVRQQL